MAEEVPSFRAQDAGWATTTLFQSLIVQLIESMVLSVEDAQRVFDLALKRARKVRQSAPDAERLLQHVHDNLKWDDFYRWSAQERQKKKPK
jgi:hypothetical protein